MDGHKHRSEYENNALGFLYTIQDHDLSWTRMNTSSTSTLCFFDFKCTI